MTALWRLYNAILIGCVVLAGMLIGAGILLVVVDVSLRAPGPPVARAAGANLPPFFLAGRR